MCSETSEAVGTTWEHAQLEFQKFLKIRITLVGWVLLEVCRVTRSWEQLWRDLNSIHSGHKVGRTLG